MGATVQRGRVYTQHPQVSDIRVLKREDLSVLTKLRPVQTLQSLRDSHHRIARAVASGIPNGEVAALCGISYNRVAILKQDPAFIDLVAHYRAMITDEWKSAVDPVTEFLGSVRTKALAMIEDKIDDASDKGEFLPSRDLATFAELGLDRTGYGKVNKNVNVNVDFAAHLEKARQRSATARVIEASPQSPSVAASAPTSPQRVPAFRRL